jgi:hypothetical protein
MRTSQVNLRRRWFIGAALTAAVPPRRAHARASGRFRVFDGLLHRGKPDLTRDGLEPIAPLSEIWRAGVSRDQVDEGGVVAALERLPSQTATTYIDIENWPIFPTDPSTRSASLDKLMRVAEIVRRQRPALKFGFYGRVPAGAYWPIIRLDSSYQQWLANNRAMAPLAQLVDYTFPSLYTFYDDPRGWLRFAAGQLDEAQRYGKPVYPFLWYQSHDSNQLLRGHDVALDAWEQELDFCRAHVDGVVLWGGFGRDWSDSAAWWQATRHVLALPAA